MKKLFLIFSLLFMAINSEAQNLLPQLQTYCKNLESEFSQISEERKKVLLQVSNFISEKYKKSETVNLTFICTHNSRRSQFGQVWAKIAATYYGYGQKIETFSGGTEITACNPRTVAALQRAGVEVEIINEISAPVTIANNPRYRVHFDKNTRPFFLFSKKYNEETNPQKDYCAILVCSQADEACPIVFGAEKRVFCPYEDPKKSDGTSEENQTYDKACRLIAREIFFVFQHISK
jgi:protein-tyrosine-phosphatase